MALISCPECGKEISDKALSCPNCGCPIQVPASSAMLWNSEKDGFITIECPECSKISRIKQSATTKTRTGYKLNGKGKCVCGLVFDEIYRDERAKSPAMPTKSRSLAVFLALILGGIGAHKFYVDKPGPGLLYLLFCWTFVPVFLGLIEAIQYLSMSEEKFQSKYLAKQL